MENIIVPFGKYKNQNISKLLADKKYVDWLKQQNAFDRFKEQPIYNLVYNMNIQVKNNEDSPTPEHNKLQNMFLKDEIKTNFILYLLDHYLLFCYLRYSHENYSYYKIEKLGDLYKNRMTIEDVNKSLEHQLLIKNFGNKQINIDKILDCIKSSIKIEFESKYNWDIYITGTEFSYKFENINENLDIGNIFSQKDNKTISEIIEEINNKCENLECHERNNLFCEQLNLYKKDNIKVDYYTEHINRYGGKYEHYQNIDNDINYFENKFKEHIEKINDKDIKQYIKYIYYDNNDNIQSVIIDFEIKDICIELKPLLGDDYPAVLRQMKKQIELTEQKGGYCIKLLIVGVFKSDVTTFKELKEIFRQHNINVVMFEEIENLKKKYRGEINNEINNKEKYIKNDIKSMYEYIILLEEENEFLREQLFLND